MLEVRRRRERKWDTAVVPAHDEDEAIGIGHADRLEQHLVDDAEYGRVDADTECQREHDGCGKRVVLAD
jgi:glyoxylase-like metal-dependent hydrolase (beta-lactamase superfamily II)